MHSVVKDKNVLVAPLVKDKEYCGEASANGRKSQTSRREERKLRPRSGVGFGFLDAARPMSTEWYLGGLVTRCSIDALKPNKNFDPTCGL